MLSDLTQILAPALITCGAAFILLPLLPPADGRARIVATSIAAALLIHYASWRLTSSLPDVGWTADFIFGVIFLFFEMGSCIAALTLLLFLSRTRNRSEEVRENSEWFSSQQAPLVDVFICTYNEERAIVERTIIGAISLAYPNFRVWVLDDGRRPWLAELTEQLGALYLTRPDNQFAKAGNINHALDHVAKLPQKPKYISILDADFVPRPQFLKRALCLFRYPNVGIVQTPQHFINPDPIQINLEASEVWPDDQRFFFDVILASKDAWGVAFCCGTSSIINFHHLRSIGGFPTDSVTEDYLLTLRMKEAGYETVYLNEPLTLGLAPEGVKEYITQRGRWCLGLMQIFRGRSGPFSLSSNLPFIHRLSLLDAFLGWTAVYYAKGMSLIIPILFLLLGIRCIDASFSEMLSRFLPYFVWQTLTIQWISKGRALAIMTDVTQLLALPTIVRAVIAGLMRPRGHKFEVTAKGGDRSRRFVEWPLFRIYAILLALNLAGVAAMTFSIFGKGPIADDTLAFAWSWYNAIVLMITCLVCIERPRYRKAERFTTTGQVGLSIGVSTSIFRIEDISITGVRLTGSAPGEAGTTGQCYIGTHRIACRIERVLPGSFALQFEETLKARIEAVKLFYEQDYVRPMTDVVPALVGKAVIRRIFQ